MARGTATSAFGVGKRESHDASAFYARFEPPLISDDDEVAGRFDVAEACVHGDIRERDDIPDRSVALVVTSPPYFAGKQYEEELGAGGVPASYVEYLDLLESVFAACVRKLEPGGRMAVNVANLGRRPYRSLSADVTAIIQDRLRLLLRGEIIWRKGEGAGGNCAWGSFARPGNPVLRDVTERVVVASKGRFDRARSIEQRARQGLPHRPTIWADDFMARTLDVWEIPPEQARRVGHPAPFPVELPAWLIGLHTYADDLVLDPFLGSGSTVVAAHRMGRRGIGYDTDAGYLEAARKRVAAEAASPGLPFAPAKEGGGGGGKAAKAVAVDLLLAAGFTIEAEKRRVRGTGVVVDLEIGIAGGHRWWCLVHGGVESSRAGLLTTEAVLKAVGRATALAAAPTPAPVLLLTTAAPRRGTDGAAVLAAARRSGVVHDVVELLDPGAGPRLAALASSAR